MYISTKKRSNLSISSALEEILTHFKSAGFKPVLVGGCVRDHFLNLPIKDYDIEVFDIPTIEILQENLKQFGRVELVGKSFGVVKLFANDGDVYDFALPRTEQKVAQGHQGFEVTTHSKLEYKEAAKRRDFTINSIGYDFNSQQFLDPYDGIEDIENRVLRHIHDSSFVEDPLRVYRAVQFAARFEFELDSQTHKLCEKMVQGGMMSELAIERIYEEFKKFLLKAKKPSIAFELIKSLGLLSDYPELQALDGCIQDKIYHPEGDVWVHTLMTLDEMAILLEDVELEEKRRLILMYAILCHDLGKPMTTEVVDGRVQSHKHEALGVEPTISFMNRLTNDKKMIEQITPLVKYHLSPFQFYDQKSSTKAVKRLSTKVNIENLCLVAKADCLGRDIEDKSKCDLAVDWLLNEARALSISQEPLKPLVQGRDLIELGLKPSKEFKTILDFGFDLQIDEGCEKEEILRLIKEKYNI